MGSQTSNHSYHGRVSNRQSALFLERLLILNLINKFLFRIFYRNVFIHRRIPLVIIHPVDNAVKVSGPLAQDPIQPLSKHRRLNFFGILRADRGKHIRKNQATL